MLAPKNQPVFYPESDGKPMAETDVHRNLLLKMVGLLQNAFPNAYVSGNICLYYEQGNPRKMISPDALLCRAQSKTEKRVYLAWEDNAQLDLVMEFSSFSTKREDHHKKKQLYEQVLKVPYYVIFDPHAVYLHVFALMEGRYQLLETDENSCCPLPDLNLQIAIENAHSLRLFDTAGNPILASDEQALKEKEDALQEKETALQEKKTALQEKQDALKEKETALQEKQDALQQTQDALKEKEDALQEKETALKEKKTALQQTQNALKEKEDALQEKETALKEQERLRALLKAAGIDPERS